MVDQTVTKQNIGDQQAVFVAFRIENIKTQIQKFTREEKMMSRKERNELLADTWERIRILMNDADSMAGVRGRRDEYRADIAKIIKTTVGISNQMLAILSRTQQAFEQMGFAFTNQLLVGTVDDKVKELKKGILAEFKV